MPRSKALTVAFFGLELVHLRSPSRFALLHSLALSGFGEARSGTRGSLYDARTSETVPGVVQLDAPTNRHLITLLHSRELLNRVV
jgi:hypothetical protein